MNNNEVVKRINEFIKFIGEVQEQWKDNNQISSDISNAVSSLVFVAGSIENGGDDNVW